MGGRKAGGAWRALHNGVTCLFLAHLDPSSGLPKQAGPAPPSGTGARLTFSRLIQDSQATVQMTKEVVGDVHAESRTP